MPHKYTDMERHDLKYILDSLPPILLPLPEQLITTLIFSRPSTTGDTLHYALQITLFTFFIKLDYFE